MEMIYSIKQINEYANRLLSNDLFLRNVTVRGEVSNFKYHDTYKCVFMSLKDDSESSNQISISAYINEKVIEECNVLKDIKNGTHVIATGSIALYEKNGICRINIKSIKEEGIGKAYKRLEELKREYADMGYFAPQYKKPLVKYAMKLGIVTAKSGAAVQDIIHVAQRRNPNIQIYLYPALVQGNGAKESISRGISILDKMGLDVIIIGRGGGSIEDLWAFNEPEVVEAVFQANTPIISAVGHQINDTITDLVADVRVATPSEAAERAVFESDELKKQMMDRLVVMHDRLFSVTKRNHDRTDAILSTLSFEIKSKIKLYREKVRKNDELINALNPEKVADSHRSRLKDIKENLYREILAVFNKTKLRFISATNSIDGLSPLARISKGFGYLEDADGEKIMSSRDVNVGDTISIYLSDGIINADVKDVKYGKKVE